MGGPNCNSKAELKKGPWTREEDQKLLAYIQENGHGSWRNLPTKAGLQRCGKSCRLRWTNYLRPDIKRGKFSSHEEKAIIRLHALLGNRWSSIAAHLPKRTDNEIKNYWNTRLKKRLTRMGIDPATHKPKNNPAGSAQSRKAAALSHMAQWEAARLEAEARLARESKLVYKIPLLHKLASPTPRPTPRCLAAPPCLDVLKVWQSTAIPACFFSSPGTSSSFDLESPTSTLNFSSSSATVPAVTVTASTPAMCNDVVSGTNGACGVGSRAAVQDSMESSYQPFDDQILHPHYDPTAPIDLPSYNQDYEEYNMGGGDTLPFVGEFEDSKNYWNYLLSMVSSPMMEPLLL